MDRSMDFSPESAPESAPEFAPKVYVLNCEIAVIIAAKSDNATELPAPGYEEFRRAPTSRRGF
jgi:hypothetical protein